MTEMLMISCLLSTPHQHPSLNFVFKVLKSQYISKYKDIPTPKHMKAYRWCIELKHIPNLGTIWKMSVLCYKCLYPGLVHTR